MKNSFELTVTKVIPASRKEVFEAWLDPQALARFMKPMEGLLDCKTEVDPREGGSFLIVMRVGDIEVPHRGEYKTISRFDRLVFTWLSEHINPGSTVTLDFKERGPRETELTLHHVGFSSDAQRASHEKGWNSVIETLAGDLA